MGVRAPRTRASQRHSRDIRHNSYPQPRSWRARGRGGTGHRTWGSFADIHGDGKTKRLPMLLPLIIHILPYRPHPTDPCLCNPASTRSPPPLVIIPLRSVIVLPTSSTSIVHPLVVQALPQVVQMMPQVGQGGGARSSSDAPRSPRGAPSNYLFMAQTSGSLVHGSHTASSHPW